MINVKQIAAQDWNNVKVSILGAGSSGIAAAKLCEKVGARPFISDHNNDFKFRIELFIFKINHFCFHIFFEIFVMIVFYCV